MNWSKDLFSPVSMSTKRGAHCCCGKIGGLLYYRVGCDEAFASQWPVFFSMFVENDAFFPS